tara:strand:- start:93 stop:362 length:270 start_codon:yes stop_codon:yes gene_type:complete
MIEAIGRIERYTADLSYDAFLGNAMVQNAVVRKLEIVGEAAKGLSPEFRSGFDGLSWRSMAAMRDRLIHGYFGVNGDIVWDVSRSGCQR